MFTENGDFFNLQLVGKIVLKTIYSSGNFLFLRPFCEQGRCCEWITKVDYELCVESEYSVSVPITPFRTYSLSLFYPFDLSLSFSCW